MSEVNKKVRIELEVYAENSPTKYEGRLIGLITDEEFNAIMKSSVLQRRVITKETVRLSEITDNYSGWGQQSLSGYRLVIAIKSKDDKMINSKKLYISEKLHLISYIRPKENECGITGESESYLILKEREV